MFRLLHACAFTAVAAAAMGGANAVADDGGYIAIGVGATPDYEGSSEQKLIPFFAGRINIANRYIESDGLSVRAGIVRIGGVEAGPVIGYRFGRDDSAKAPAVALLQEIDDAVEIGAFIARSFDGVFSERDALRFSIEALHDVSGVHDGWIASPSIRYSAPARGKWAIATSVSASIVSDSYTDAYFSISPEASAASGLAAYGAQGGVKDIGVSTQWTYQFREKWGVTGCAGYKRLLADSARSTVVAAVGDKDQVTVGIGLSRAF